MSKLEDKIIKGLEDIGYTGPLSKYSQLQTAVEVGPKHEEYTQLVSFLTSEIRTLESVDEEVNPISSPEDSVAFVMEITSFLKELNCPYQILTHGLVSERLQNIADRLLLLDYLITELMSARILQDKKPEKKIELKLQETPEAADMRLILQTLRFPKPPANITITQLFDKLDTTIPLAIKKAGRDLIGSGIFSGFLSDKQWEILKGVQNDLDNEYKIRREMLLTRLDVTVQSFQWSERTKGKDELFEKIYHDKRISLKIDPDVNISDLISARTDLAIIEKTSSAAVRKNTRTDVNKVIIGQVPDRGGRSWEQAPPPPEMPSWQQQRTTGGGNQRGGGQSFSGGRGGVSRNDGRPSGYYKQGFQGGRNSGGYQDFGNSNYSNRGGYQDQGNSSFDNHSYDNRGGNDGYNNYGRGGGNNGYFNRRESSYNQDYQQNKRPKTYDSFQANKTTYADQYVEENQHNQQYQRGRNSYQRGRSNYHRGGGGGYR
ncbi:protein FAM98A [Sitophilus oryzae]|uniref:Protein FAM98A n=1 Tax=Sitophilus oryzae TaxID=7048 RepID=A0A6J2YCZ7_SITOR|nr:protein FAM98A [Sitophilus oryzae]